jgi:heptosyltransferase-2
MGMGMGTDTRIPLAHPRRNLPSPPLKALPKTPMRILVRMPNWLGDIVMALPFLHALESLEEEKEIYLLIPDAFSAVAQGYGTILPFRTRWESHVVSWNLRLRLGFRKGLDVGFSLPSSYTSHLNLILAGARYRIGFAREGEFLLHDSLPLPSRGEEHLSRSYLRLLKGLKGREVRIPDPLPSVEFPSLRLKKDAVPAPPSPLSSWERVWILLPFTTYGSAKELPLDLFVQIARYIQEKGWEPVFAGTKGEGERARGILQGFPQAFGRYTISDWIAILPRVSGVVGNDSGFVHLSSTLGVLTVVFFLSTSPQWTAPRGRRVRILYDPVPCSPCFARSCPFGHYACKAIWTRARVLDALEGALKP